MWGRDRHDAAGEDIYAASPSLIPSIQTQQSRRDLSCEQSCRRPKGAVVRASSRSTPLGQQLEVCNGTTHRRPPLPAGSPRRRQLAGDPSVLPAWRCATRHHASVSAPAVSMRGAHTPNVPLRSLQWLPEILCPTTSSCGPGWWANCAVRYVIAHGAIKHPPRGASWQAEFLLLPPCLPPC